MTRPGWIEAVAVGAATGSVAAVVGVAADQTWLLAAVPIGAIVGGLVSPSIRPGRRLPWGRLAGATLLADALGAWTVATALLVEDRFLRNAVVGDGFLADAVVFGLTSFAFAGIPMFLFILPFTLAAAVALRHLRARRVA